MREVVLLTRRFYWSVITFIGLGALASLAEIFNWTLAQSVLTVAHLISTVFLLVYAATDPQVYAKTSQDLLDGSTHNE